MKLNNKYNSVTRLVVYKAKEEMLRQVMHILQVCKI